MVQNTISFVELVRMGGFSSSYVIVEFFETRIYETNIDRR